VLTVYLQGSMLGIASEKLTLRLRRETFKAYLHQDMGWFDSPENSTGTLTTKLAVDASLVKGVSLYIVFLKLLCFVGYWCEFRCNYASVIISFCCPWNCILFIVATNTCHFGLCPIGNTSHSLPVP